VRPLPLLPPCIRVLLLLLLLLLPLPASSPVALPSPPLPPRRPHRPPSLPSPALRIRACLLANLPARIASCAAVALPAGMAGTRCPPDEPASSLSLDQNTQAHYSDDERSVAADSWSVKSEYGSTLDGDDQRNADVVDALNASFRPTDYMYVPVPALPPLLLPSPHTPPCAALCQFARWQVFVATMCSVPLGLAHCLTFTAPVFVSQLSTRFCAAQGALRISVVKSPWAIH
jgi:hypothetical protein